MTETRGRANRRLMRHKAISRKKQLSRQLYGQDWYGKDGQYDKGKIHCGCEICKPGKKHGLPTTKDLKYGSRTAGRIRMHETGEDE